MCVLSTIYFREFCFLPYNHKFSLEIHIEDTIADWYHIKRMEGWSKCKYILTVNIGWKLITKFLPFVYFWFSVFLVAFS